MNIQRCEANSKPPPGRKRMNNKPKDVGAPQSNTSTKTINGKILTEVDVIYVIARHAKGFKVGLESLGLLDKRYKLVPANKSDCNEKLIAIPITKQCIDTITTTEGSFTEASSQFVLERIHPNPHSVVIGVGKEMVPFSSSSMSKMNQKKGL